MGISGIAENSVLGGGGESWKPLKHSGKEVVRKLLEARCSRVTDRGIELVIKYTMEEEVL